MIYPYCCDWRTGSTYPPWASSFPQIQPSVKVISYATVEPITLAEARLHLRLDTYGSPPEHPDDSLILAQISAAREWCEKYLGLAIANQTLEVGFDSFPSIIDLPSGPVVSIDYIRYLDADGIETTIELPDYIYDSYSGRVLPGLETPWPAVQGVPNAVKVRYQVGYALAGESPTNNQLPYAIRAAILLMLGHLYEHREGVAEGTGGSTLPHELPMGITTLLDFYRTRKGFA